MKHVGPKSHIGVQLGGDLMTIARVAYNFRFSFPLNHLVTPHHHRRDPSNGDMFHHWVKVITRYNFVLICSDPHL